MRKKTEKGAILVMTSVILSTVSFICALLSVFVFRTYSIQKQGVDKQDFKIELCTRSYNVYEQILKYPNLNWDLDIFEEKLKEDVKKVIPKYGYVGTDRFIEQYSFEIENDIYMLSTKINGKDHNYSISAMIYGLK